MGHVPATEIGPAPANYRCTEVCADEESHSCRSQRKSEDRAALVTQYLVQTQRKCNHTQRSDSPQVLPKLRSPLNLLI